MTSAALSGFTLNRAIRASPSHLATTFVVSPIGLRSMAWLSGTRQEGGGYWGACHMPVRLDVRPVHLQGAEIGLGGMGPCGGVEPQFCMYLQTQYLLTIAAQKIREVSKALPTARQSPDRPVARSNQPSPRVQEGVRCTGRKELSLCLGRVGP